MLEFVSVLRRLVGGDTKVAPTVDDRVLVVDVADNGKIKESRIGDLPSTSSRSSFVVSLPVGINDDSLWVPAAWKRRNEGIDINGVKWYRSCGSVYIYPGVDLTGVTSFKLIVNASAGSCPMGVAFRLGYIDGRDGIDHNPLPLGSADAYQTVIPPSTSVPPAPSIEFPLPIEQRLSCVRLWSFWRPLPLVPGDIPDDYLTSVQFFNVQFYY